MSERITALITSNGSFSYTTPLREFYQGSAYDLYLDVQFENKLEDGSAVQIMFRRSDGKQTSWLPMNTIDFETYTIKLDDGWYWAKEGDLTFTVQAYKKLDKVLTILATSYSSIYVNPTPSFYEPSPLAPNAYQGIITDIAELKYDLDQFKSEGLVTTIEGDIEPEGTDYAKIKYTKTDDSEEEVRIKLPSGLATDSDIDAKLEETNPVKSIVSTNDDLQFKYKNVSGETTVTLKSNGIVKKTELEDFASDLVSFSHTGAKEEIENQVYFARRAEADSEGNIINETYVNNNKSQDIVKRSFNIERTYSDNPTYVHYTADDSGTINILTKDESGNDGTFYFKPSTGLIRTIGPVNINNNIQNIPFKNNINTFEQPQVFTERIDILNSDGTYDSIKHMNNNFLISASDGTSLMDIDHNLNIVKFLGKEIAYLPEVNEILEKPVFVEIRVGDGEGYFEGNYTLPCNSRSSFILVDESTHTSYICVVQTTSTSANITSVIPLNDAPQLQNITAQIIRVIKVGDL